MMDGRTILRVDIEFYIEITTWALLVFRSQQENLELVCLLSCSYGSVGTVYSVVVGEQSKRSQGNA